MPILRGAGAYCVDAVVMYSGGDTPPVTLLMDANREKKQQNYSEQSICVHTTEQSAKLSYGRWQPQSRICCPRLGVSE
jgi:hypothetical protein